VSRTGRATIRKLYPDGNLALTWSKNTDKYYTLSPEDVWKWPSRGTKRRMAEITKPYTIEEERQQDGTNKTKKIKMANSIKARCARCPTPARGKHARRAEYNFLRSERILDSMAQEAVLDLCDCTHQHCNGACLYVCIPCLEKHTLPVHDISSIVCCRCANVVWPYKDRMCTCGH
jgi:hypothetical protein